MRKKELSNLRLKDKNELEKILADERKKLQQLYLDLSLAKLKNVREIRKVKKNIAQILTILREK